MQHEERRLKNIKENQQMLMSLGLKDVQVSYTMWRMVSVLLLLLMLVYTQPPAVKVILRGAGNVDSNTGLQIVSIGAYSYTISPDDLQREQQAFEAGEGVRTCKQSM